jgi:hypothetical protein
MGVNASWELLDTLTPAVPFLDRIVDRIETSFRLVHSPKHMLPDRQLDVRGLVRMYQAAGILNHCKGRADPAKGNSPKDVLTLGQITLQDTDYLEQLFDERWSFIKNQRTLEDYNLPVNSAEMNSDDYIGNGQSEDSLTSQQAEDDIMDLDIDWAAQLP